MTTHASCGIHPPAGRSPQFSIDSLRGRRTRPSRASSAQALPQLPQLRVGEPGGVVLVPRRGCAQRMGHVWAYADNGHVDTDSASGYGLGLRLRR